MEFIRFLRAESDAFDVRLLSVAVFTGLVTGAMVALIVSVAENPKDGLGTLWILLQFVVCFLFFIRTRRWVLQKIASIVAEVIGHIRGRIIERIANAELRQFESMGKNRFYTALSQDTIVISESATPIVNAASSAVVTIFALVCIAIVSMPAFLIVGGMIGLAVIHFRRRQRIVKDALKTANQCEKRFFELFEHVLDGFKEVKVNRRLNDDLFDNHLHPVGAQVVRLKQLASDETAGLIVFAQGFFYVLIAFMLFIWPSFSSLEHDSAVRIVTLILFIIGPIGEVVGAMPVISKAGVAIRNLYNLERSLGHLKPAEVEAPYEAAEYNLLTPPDFAVAAAPGGAVSFDSFSSIALKQVRFSYDINDHFELGPIDLNVRRGEILFLVGGNGSGKSTLLKVLTGLYESTAGQLLVDGKQIEYGNIARYRSLFSIIFHDFHLFDRLYGMGNFDRDEAAKLISMMGLTGLTRIFDDGSISRVNLSTGQRKRLVLLITQLEQRPVIVLDEWAADQDPHFRRFFYRQLLPELAARGKTIIAATHDDHYFDVADRILKIDGGKLEAFSPGL